MAPPVTESARSHVAAQQSVTLEAIQDARQRIERFVLRTPVVACPALREPLGADVLFKCENLQHVGAFKARGATNAVFSLSDEQARVGVVTHSSGNHAAALARAAQLRGILARIVMPHDSRPNKLAAVRRYGVEPTLCEPTAEARQAAADAIVGQTGATLVHPYNDPHVIAGQGTVALELLEQLADVDDVVVPLGGGGLLAGCLVAIKSLRPELQVVAAEPALADDGYRGHKSGRIELPQRYDTVADGLRTPLGTLTFPIIHALVDDILLVDEDRIRQATRMMLEVAKLVAEPSGAVPLGCLLQHTARFSGRRVALIVSGGNL